jgi:hypothetical protein
MLIGRSKYMLLQLRLGIVSMCRLRSCKGPSNQRSGTCCCSSNYSGMDNKLVQWICL